MRNGIGIGLAASIGRAGTARRAAAGYTATGSFYDGTNDFQLRGADLTGIADGKAGIISLWVRFNGSDGVGQNLLHGATGAAGIRIVKLTDNTLRASGFNTTNTNILQLTTNSTFVASAAWIHVLMSWDLAAGVGYSYINGGADKASGSVLTDDTIDYTKGNFAIGAAVAGSGKINADLSEVFFHTSFLDISVEANRLKFYDAWLRPKSLGADGSTPLGVQPLLYVPTGDASGTGNKGSGGAFTTTGALTASSTSPTD